MGDDTNGRVRCEGGCNMHISLPRSDKTEDHIGKGKLVCPGCMKTRDLDALRERLSVQPENKAHSAVVLELFPEQQEEPPRG